MKQVVTHGCNPVVQTDIVLCVSGFAMMLCALWVFLAAQDWANSYEAQIAVCVFGACGACTMTGAVWFLCLAKRRGVPILVRRTHVTGLALQQTRGVTV